MPDITLVITSCARHDLLERTLRSFNRFNSYPITRTVIVEDSDLDAPEWLKSLELGEKLWITNGKRKGQIYSVDRAYAEVQTPYIFHCEDDWEWFKEGFIEKSLDILERYPNILQCSLREDWEHPSVNLPDFPFPVNQPDWRGGWSGFAFNPGLRRLKDYVRIGSYGREVGYDPSFVGELHLSKLYRGLGFYAAALPAHCKHIGEGNRHVPWETAPKVPKVLIAIPACHEYDYGKHLDDKIDHINKVSNARIDAVRATWAKYVPAFKSYVDLRFFYGALPAGALWTKPEADEVMLDVPDDYDHLPHKVKAIYQWALANKYEYAYKGDDDGFVYLDRLMASGFEDHDYIGYTTADPTHPIKERYASGGPGYCVSKRSMEILAKEDIGKYWAEDWWVGNTLQKNGIAVTRDGRYLPGFERHYVDLKKLPNPHNYISFHACTPDMMKELYDANPSPTFKLVTHALGESESFTGKCALNFVGKERFSPVSTVKRHNGGRILIAILSCHHRTALPKAQRETWLKDIRKYPVDYKYFLGRIPIQEGYDPRRSPSNQANGYQTMPDEVILDVPDDYDSLPMKTKAMLVWAKEHGYDWVFKCDQDTYCHVERLLASGFEQRPYTGFRRTSDYFGAPRIAYAQGGAGYWLNRRMMELVIAEDAGPLRGGPEDINVARILTKHGISVFHDFRYQPAMAWPLTPDNDFITAHQCTPEEMRGIHQRFSKQPSTALLNGAGSGSKTLEMERVETCEAQG